jgi:hypothetical protein
MPDAVVVKEGERPDAPIPPGARLRAAHCETVNGREIKPDLSLAMSRALYSTT